MITTIFEQSNAANNFGHKLESELSQSRFISAGLAKKPENKNICHSIWCSLDQRTGWSWHDMVGFGQFSEKRGLSKARAQWNACRKNLFVLNQFWDKCVIRKLRINIWIFSKLIKCNVRSISSSWNTTEWTISVKTSCFSSNQVYDSHACLYFLYQ